VNITLAMFLLCDHKNMSGLASRSEGIRAFRIQGFALIAKREASRMSMKSHIAELVRKHEILEEQIHQEALTPSGDDLRVAALKREKLRIKDEIIRLSMRMAG
jgi:hypothetical protein